MYSQTENSETTFTFKKLNNSIRLNHISVNMPTEKVSYDLAPKMSLVGLNYNVPLFCCSLSIDSNKALKFPAPNPLAPIL